MTKTKMHPAQQDIFSDQLINIESPHYNLGLYVDLKGPLDIQKFQVAVNTSPQVFDVFKMRFDTDEPELYCYINEQFDTLELSQIDFSRSPNAKDSCKQWMQEQFNISIPLERERVLAETCLIKLAEDHHYFFFKFHHLIIDAYGFAIWLNYISAKYLSLVNNQNVHFNYPTYAGQISKAVEFYNSEEYILAGNYWKDKIKEKPENLLHKKYKISDSNSSISANYYVPLTNDFRKVLSELHLATKSNPQQLLIASLLVYYAQITTDTELAFGIPFHKRGKDEQRDVAGMFSGILPFKHLVKKDITLTELLSEIKEGIREDYVHRHYLAGDLSRNLKTSISESYLCDVIVNYVPFNFDLNFGEGITTNIYWLLSEYERTGLQICLRDYTSTQPLELGLHYGVEYFNKDEIQLFSQRIIHILEQFSVSLDNKIQSIDILPPKEKRLVESFNNTLTRASTSETIVSAFIQQTSQTPDLTAVVYDVNSISYGELDKQSDQLAYFLAGKGIQREMLVPICLERGVAMITGILGILKAGAAYVPIDPEHPAERIQYILEDTKAQLVVTSERTDSKFQTLRSISTIRLDKDSLEIARAPVVALPPVTPGNLAYVIYTSGSTGKPKGVMIEHRSYMNLNQAYHSINPGEQTVLTCTYVFDVSVLEIFSTLLAGGCLNIPSPSTITDPVLYAEFLFKQKVSTAYIHPMYLDDVATILDKYDDCYLKQILVGVEPISTDVIQWYLNKKITILNGYGPTEATICATFYDVEDKRQDLSILPIGKPITNYKIFIAGENNVLSPIGVPGQICIGGAGLARGYLNRPDLTAEKFIENPFVDDEEGLKVYKTGDVGRWLTDGNIQYIGRIDNQVKIRGYRIELGEIEAALLQDEIVRQCVVTARQDKEGAKQLVGYVVPEEVFDREAIIANLKNKLPAYMVPALWVELESLPLTANGKVNRKALPEPILQDLTTREYVAPGNELELALATIWQKLLQLDKVGIHDNFFNLGGHSLLAVKLINNIRKETGKVLQVSELVEYSTIDKLAKLIAGKRKAETAVKTNFLVPIKPQGSNPPLYIVCGAGGTALTFYNFADLLSPSQPVFVLQQPTEIKNREEFGIKSVEDIAEKYLGDILIKNPKGPYLLSGHCMGGVVAFEMARQLKAKGKEVKLLALFDSVVPQKKTDSSANTLSSISTLQKSIHKAYSKLDFEFYLLLNHPKHALQYKLNGLKKFLNKVVGSKADNDELDVFRQAEREYEAAIVKYIPKKFNGKVLAFYAKEHYEFVDRNRNIHYKRVEFDDKTKDRWKNHTESITIIDIEGEHSTIFDPANAKEFARLLQEHINSIDQPSPVFKGHYNMQQA